MGYIYFFLDHPDDKLSSSIDLFNMPSTKFNPGYKEQKLYIHAFYSDGNEWKYHLNDSIEPNRIKSLKKQELPFDFWNKSVFVTLSENQSIDLSNKTNVSQLYNAYPPWRSNIKIYGNHMGASYQGEIPESFLDLKLSLISCSPMFQQNKDIENFFYLVNLNRDPRKLNFTIDILTSKRRVLSTLEGFTNRINCYKLDHFISGENNGLLIFRSNEFGGIPLYFSKNSNNSSLSLEHTHPPVEQIYGGKRYIFQKRKKNYWFI
jgi:hypothetical protein